MVLALAILSSQQRSIFPILAWLIAAMLSGYVLGRIVVGKWSYLYLAAALLSVPLAMDVHAGSVAAIAAVGPLIGYSFWFYAYGACRRDSSRPKEDDDASGP